MYKRSVKNAIISLIIKNNLYHDQKYFENCFPSSALYSFHSVLSCDWDTSLPNNNGKMRLKCDRGSVLVYIVYLIANCYARVEQHTHHQTHSVGEKSGGRRLAKKTPAGKYLNKVRVYIITSHVCVRATRNHCVHFPTAGDTHTCLKHYTTPPTLCVCVPR